MRPMQCKVLPQPRTSVFPSQARVIPNQSSVIPGIVPAQADTGIGIDISSILGLMMPMMIVGMMGKMMTGAMSS